jgi:hypothetical protein
VVTDWWVVDGEGRDGAAFIKRTMAALDGGMSDQGCLDFLIRNCGFAAVRQLGNNAQVRFRPFTLTEPAFYGLGYLLYHLPWQRAMASIYVDEAWRDEILPWDHRGALEYIAEIVNEHQLRLSEKVLRRARPLGTIPTGSPMDWAFHVWRHRPDLAPSEHRGRILTDVIRGRYAWIDAYGPGRELIMAEVGGGFPAPVHAALEPALGARIEDQPDNAFGRYCAEAYGKVARSGEPLLEDIDAMVTPPNGEPVRRRYSRLILPFRVSDDHTRLLGISFENLAIDLRRRAG